MNSTSMKEVDSVRIKRKEIFFNNLVLLGLDQVSLEKKYGIPFNRDMFSLPNKKAYEVVTYFLFMKLSAATGIDYNLPWPLVSKEMDRLFQKTCYTHLSNFAQEKEVKFPRIFPSLLSAFGGDRFYKLYLAFSCYVLNNTIKNNGNMNYLSRPNVTQDNFNSVKDLLQLSTILSKDKFVDLEDATYLNDLLWTKYARNLSECLQKLKLMLKTDKDLLKSKTSTISSVDSTVPGENFFEKLIENKLLHWKPARRQRKDLEQFFLSEEKLWQYVASEVGEKVPNVLDGKDIDVADCLLEKLCCESKEVSICSSKEDGKLSVVRFMTSFMSYLKPITALLKKNMSEVPETSFVNDELSLTQDLSSIENFNKRLTKEIIPNLEERVKKLKALRTPEDFDTSEIFDQLCPLPNVCYNPDAVKERVSLTVPDLEEKLQLKIPEEVIDNDVCSAHLPVSKSSSAVSTSVADLTNFSFPNLTSYCFDATSARKVALVNSCKQKLVKEDECTETSKQNEVFAEGYPSSSSLDITDLDDKTPYKPFKMRDSWLHEESLQTMTLPDISFED